MPVQVEDDLLVAGNLLVFLGVCGKLYRISVCSRREGLGKRLVALDLRAAFDVGHRCARPAQARGRAACVLLGLCRPVRVVARCGERGGRGLDGRIRFGSAAAVERKVAFACRLREDFAGKLRGGHGDGCGARKGRPYAQWGGCVRDVHGGVAREVHRCVEHPCGGDACRLRTCHEHGRRCGRAPCKKFKRRVFHDGFRGRLSQVDACNA